ncbi:MAG: HAD hydrolase-like protein [Parasporobacterium sp.]|nr:HAD hydrolase-like protein [Parasporobacterium sp.]
MMEKIIFDLDGTLLDTSPGIYECARFAGRKLGFPELSEEQLYSFVGPPLKDSFMRAYGCSEEDGQALTDTYREHYREGAVLKAEPYDGIFELLDSLSRMGLDLAVATAKPQIFAEQVLEHFGFSKYMSEICGADLTGKLTKTDIIRKCVGDREASACVMVGDTEHDAKGAYEAGVPFIGVSYGFGNPEKRANYPAIGIAASPLEILNFVA